MNYQKVKLLLRFLGLLLSESECRYLDDLLSSCTLKGRATMEVSCVTSVKES